MTGPLLALEDIRKNYGAIEALRGVTFAIGKGEVVALLGDNGAGKSTLVNIIAGGLEPTSGRMLFEGREFLARSPAECLMVGDSAADMEAGRRAGVKICAVRYGYGKQEDLNKWAPDYWVSDLRELLTAT